MSVSATTRPGSVPFHSRPTSRRYVRHIRSRNASSRKRCGLLLHCRQKSDELAWTKPALDLATDADGGLTCFNPQNEREAVDSPIALEQFQLLFARRPLQVGEEAAISDVRRRIETPRAGKVAGRGLSVGEPGVKTVQALEDVRYVSVAGSAACALQALDQAVSRFLRLLQARIEAIELGFKV